MKDSQGRIIIDYYSDVLCVWAWIAQPRLEQLLIDWGEKICIRHRFVDIFGDSHKKIQSRWGKENGFEKFGKHVFESAKPFESSSVNELVWKSSQPTSSMLAHLVLKGVERAFGPEQVNRVALSFRKSFFLETKDISDLDLLFDIIDNLSLDSNKVKDSLNDGTAMASLSNDLKDASSKGVKGSPTWVLNDGRQVLYGNIGYRILNANIEEFIKNPASEASWC